MLKRLYISNFALISEMDVAFPGKLTVITGETGAGKSIFLEALALALGKRADLLALKNAAKKCVVEAEFETSDLDLLSFFEENDLEFSTGITLRREISADGKSRSFLNDSLVNLNVLKLLSEKLIDIHSQHETLLLNQSDFQLEVMDAFAGSLDLFKDYKHEYTKLSKLNAELKNLTEQEIAARKELDYYKFLFEELEQVDLQAGIIKQLEEECATLENAETIKTNLLNAAYAINGGEQNLLGSLNQVKQLLNGLTKYNKRYQEFFERVNSTHIELKEIASEMEDAESLVDVDKSRQEEVNEKLDKLNRLLKKHNVSNEEELVKIKEEIEEKLVRFTSLETTIGLLSKQIERCKNTCLKLAKQLSDKRQKTMAAIEKEVKEMLLDLSMENAVFKIAHKTLPEPGPNGLDEVSFLFSANKGQELSALQKVASGGELSRLMLSIKSLLAKRKKLPTIIFDEIDTGVSGDVADKIGNILALMGNHMQVITITHLPQIASKGAHHLFVYKNDEAEKTVSHIKELHNDDRVTEIAKMLSTGKPTQSALVNAKELLSMKSL
ncbi:MAG: DNA repair protein RecN [Bacteroidia bacterium]|nr:DNA repair protein RecN [Bacteroidia bacterium]